MTPVLARLRGVVRRFGAVTALAGADLEVRGGEVHGVLGENGAGKTTLLGILGGMIRLDGGSLEVGGEPVELTGPRAAWGRGVGLVHQHFTLVPELTVLENLALGRDPGISGLKLNLEATRKRVERLMLRTGLAVPMDAMLEDLGVGDRQRVEILKAMLREPRVLVLDEPTAVLTPAEVSSLFTMLRVLASEGRAVVLVAHKIDEVLAVADRITVMRNGQTVLTALREDVDEAALIRAMVGSEVALDVAAGAAGGRRARAGRTQVSGSTPSGSGEPVTELVGVSVTAPSGSEALREVSLSVRRGEIVGVAGVEGNGQRELALVLAGRLVPDSGRARVAAGVGFIPQDRTTEGLIPGFDLVENVALALHDDRRYGGGPGLAWGRMRAETEAVVARFGVVTPDVETHAGALSGGNQQRVVVGRELLRATDLLVADNPTRGLDVAATAFVHREIVRLAESSTAPGVVLLSTDLDEILALSDRVLVMVGGGLVPVPQAQRSRAGVGSLMLRVRDAGA